MKYSSHLSKSTNMVTCTLNVQILHIRDQKAMLGLVWTACYCVYINFKKLSLGLTQEVWSYLIKYFTQNDDSCTSNS